ncbi:hypothetical protein L2E82_50062 [Cichorium intybus]|nr:hypothetical protein L2E82_50062 [Cichorium intybus]
MVINMEWGNFWSSHLPRTSYDIDLHAESQNPNDQGFEKMISGMYLGRMVRRVIHKMSLESDIFGPVSSKLCSVLLIIHKSIGLEVKVIFQQIWPSKGVPVPSEDTLILNAIIDSIPDVHFCVLAATCHQGFRKLYNYNNPGCNSSTVTFGRRASSGRYVNYSRDDLHGEIGSTEFMNYTVHIPLYIGQPNHGSFNFPKGRRTITRA